ncbi:MAG: hypothetical protein A2075_05955 [Geobacteraceae bacterium GWC2_58_44]|nr:MAG: hypothetical protein A2075_05955 [Geobacteraceae bacterium GWC2_58_44]
MKPYPSDPERFEERAERTGDPILFGAKGRVLELFRSKFCEMFHICQPADIFPGTGRASGGEAAAAGAAA